MFKRKTKIQPDSTHAEPTTKRTRNWTKIYLIISIAIIVVFSGIFLGMGVIHESDTNPQFCATCHIMEPYVASYLNSHTMDSVHAKAGVQCKECHSDYDVPAEIESGIKFITGNYDKSMPQRRFEDDVCTQCHISMEYMASQTDYLRRNPHASHWPDLKCRSCHISHDEQVDYCSQCHDNGGQRLTGAEIFPRVDNPYDQYPDTTATPSH